MSSTYSKTSSCPRCGAPIYVPTIWHSITPPPPAYTCSCSGHTNQTWFSGATFNQPPPWPATPPFEIINKTSTAKDVNDSQKAIEELLKVFDEVKKTNSKDISKNPIEALYDAFEENAMLIAPVTNDDIMKKLKKIELTMALIFEKLKI